MSVQYCESFGLELLQGVHDFSTDTFKLALYSADASFGVATTAYTATNEVSATGYTAGGAALTVTSTYPKLEAGYPSVRFNTPVTWTLTSAVASLRWGMIYNSTEGNRAVAVIDMGREHVNFIGVLNWKFPLSIDPIVAIRFAGASA